MLTLSFKEIFFIYFFWLQSLTSGGCVNALLTSVFLSTESEATNNTGVPETQPSGDFYGDSKSFFITEAVSFA